MYLLRYGELQGFNGGIMVKQIIIKASRLLIILISIVTLIGILPVFKVNVSGIDNYRPEDSTLGLTQHLFPNEDFLNQFTYITGDYHYSFNGSLEFGHAVAFSVIEYSPKTYMDAKEFCFQKFKSTDIHQYQVGEYYFIEHLWNVEKNSTGALELKCRFPEIFNMFAYNDSLCTLIFIGYYENDFDSKIQWNSATFKEFYREQFSKYYELQGMEG